WQVPAILILQNNGRLLKENDCYGAFDEPATIEALRYYLSFFQDGLAVRSMTEVSNLYQGFSDGVFSMMITGPWNINEMRKRFTEMTGRWSTAPMPMKQNGSSIAGGASLVIFKNTKNVAAAWKLVEFLSRSEIQIEFFRLTRDLPAVKTAWQSEELLNDREIRAFYTQLESVLPTPKIAEWEQVAVKIQEHLEKAIFEKVDLSEMVANLNTDVNQILEKRRWLLERGLIQAAE
ncbi:extracellular solute-binding protein, partial [candidate division KSB1 bacterium]|nr:extracellular solute-binding protein [candidate division KSB1 bacterium]